METFQIFLRKNIHNILAGRMQDGAQYLARPELMLLVWTTLLSFRCWIMWSSINIRCTPPSTHHGICTDYCFIMKMKSNCYEVILRLNKPKTMDSSLIITVFLSPMDCFTSSYPYLFKWNVTLYKILLWLKFDEIPSKVCHSPRTYHTQKGSVTSIWSNIGRNEIVMWIEARVSKFT